MSDIDLNGSGLRLVSGRSGTQFRDAPSFRSQEAGNGASDGTGTSVAPPGPEPQEDSRVVPVDEAVSSLNDYVQTVQRDLEFEVDRELGQTIVRVVDRETGEVIRQIPDEVALKLAENLQQDEPLTLFSVRV